MAESAAAAGPDGPSPDDDPSAPLVDSRELLPVDTPQGAKEDNAAGCCTCCTWVSWFYEEEQHINSIDAMLQQSERERPFFQILVKLLVLRSSFWIEIGVSLFFFYYLDVFLDLGSIYTFWLKQDIAYVTLNTMAIMVAGVYSFVEMYIHIPPGETKEVLLIGFLTPFSLHMAVICWISLRDRQRHPLLYSGKLAEAAVEAFISALVQTYALYYSDWKEDLIGSRIVTASLLSSFFAIGYSFMKFDDREVGLNGIPGELTGFDWKKVVILVFRVAEVTSRITSLAVFSVLTREDPEEEGMDRTPFAQDWPLPFRSCAELFLRTLGPPLVLLDFIVLALAIHYSGRAWYRAFASVLCFVNPLLELGNPSTLRAYWYYGWRLLQLSFMGAYVAESTGAKKTLALKEEVAFNHVITWGCVVSTCLWLFFLPLIRCCLAKHGPISWYDIEICGSKQFEQGQIDLMDDLAKTQKEKLQRIVEETLQGCIDDFHKSRPSHNMMRSAEAAGHPPDGGPGLPMRSLGGSPSLRFAFRDGSEEAGHPVQGWLKEKVYKWAEGVVEEYWSSVKKRQSGEDLFRRSLTVAANLINKEQACVTKQMLLQVLTCFAKAMSENKSMLDIAYSQLKLFMPMLVWQWDDEEIDMELHEQKLTIIEMLWKRGWEARRFKFFDDAKGLMEVFDAQCATGHGDDESARTMAIRKDHWQKYAPRQMQALVRLWRSTSTTVSEKQRHSEDFQKLFRADVEWKAMVQGARVMEEDLADFEIWEDEDLLNFCAAGSEADKMNFWEAATDVVYEKDDIQDRVKRLVEAKIDDLKAQFEAAMRTASSDPNSNSTIWTAAQDLQQELKKITERKHLYEWMDNPDGQLVVERCEELIEDCETRKGVEFKHLKRVIETFMRGRNAPSASDLDYAQEELNKVTNFMKAATRADLATSTTRALS